MKTRKEESQFVAMGDAGADKRPDDPEEEAYGPRVRRLILERAIETVPTLR